MPSRRLSDKIIDAHTVACEEGKREIAKLLLDALEIDLSAMGGINTEHREWSEAMEGAFSLHEKTFGDIHSE
ncbi:MAG: hypothetical protein OQK24_07825 [Magnetovibrio sp.]|nr:hypothetical protein [Magnetovibrio sp.]